MITTAQGKVIGRGYRETVKRVNDMDDYQRLSRDYKALEAKFNQLTRRYNELEQWATDIDQNFKQRVNEQVQELIGEQSAEASAADITPEEAAIIAVDRHGEYIDAHGTRWVNIARAAKIKGVAYQTIYRAATGVTKSAKIKAWTVGELSNGNDRILVNPDSYQRGKRGKRT